jgi:FkbM family methyltransferase
MVIRLKRIIANLLGRFGYEIRSSAALTQIDLQSRFGALLAILSASPQTSNLTLQEASIIVSKSQSQLGQDVLALSLVGKNKRGFFVEFGATDGKSLSNSYLLEKEFGWSGILCEPGKAWHSELRNNRTAAIDTRCVFSSTGKLLEFTETSVGELSTISSFMKSDANRFLRKNSGTYQVETVSLEDLLLTHNAPRYIEFLSVDTEGSEFEILKGFPFDQYRFGLICVEHNYTNNREKIHELLTGKGYERVFTEYSAFDDWYLFPTT